MQIAKEPTNQCQYPTYWITCGRRRPCFSPNQAILRAADGAIHPLPERTGPSALWYPGNVDGHQRLLNTLMIQNVLADPGWLGRMGEEDFRALTPLIHAHVNPYGRFELDMETRLPLDDPAGLMA